MSTRGEPCPFEEAVTAAAASGDWNEELRIHRDGCLSCAEVTLVVAALAGDEQDLLEDPRPLPEPSVIWLRARLTQREHCVRRATRGIAAMQRAALAVAAAIGIAFAPALWRLVSGVVAALHGSDLAVQLPRAAGSPLLVLVMSMVVLGGLALWELTGVHSS